ncbi:unnamed protein product [Didymodactylos carnosus]|uniref:Uncharacterized protein n=1 Tax=Didymodactylos carnosus TaxID=1234261 RepID=A0A814ASL1_9BILA|nr:unnamed protein product [Didymodactylos carnosus]CAF0917802.1 unnamed protein product [Didymodactylos carnosus]CAF3543452.1 unnamed protein product [Didymodactylos carnosus]CAF3697689.1 unnamed protein product [Didymodactylos carnosus]
MSAFARSDSVRYGCLIVSRLNASSSSTSIKTPSIEATKTQTVSNTTASGKPSSSSTSDALSNKQQYAGKPQQSTGTVGGVEKNKSGSSASELPPSSTAREQSNPTKTSNESQNTEGNRPVSFPSSSKTDNPKQSPQPHEREAILNSMGGRLAILVVLGASIYGGFKVLRNNPDVKKDREHVQNEFIKDTSDNLHKNMVAEHRPKEYDPNVKK